MQQSELAVREFFDLIQQAFDVAKTISLVFALIISTDYFWVLLMTTKPKANFLTTHSVLPVSHGLPEDLHHCFLFNLTSYYPDSPGQIIPLLPPVTNSAVLTQASSAPQSSKASSSSKHFIMQPEKKVPGSQVMCARPCNHLAHESWFPNFHHKSSFQYLFPPANFKIPRNSLNYKASLHSSGIKFILGFICHETEMYD